LTVGGTDIDDTHSGGMSCDNSDLLRAQFLAYEFPVLSGVYGTIETALGQGKDHTMVDRID
jgi:hypothetical protein